LAVGAGAWNSNQQQQQQTRDQQGRPSWDAPSYHAQPSTSAYPPATPASTTKLLHDNVEQREMQQHLENQREQAQSQPFSDAPYGAQQAAGAGVAAAALVGAGAAAVDSKKSQDTSPFAESPGQGAVYVVKRTFEPSLDDELVLFVSLFPLSRVRAPNHACANVLPLTAWRSRSTANQVRRRMGAWYQPRLWKPSRQGVRSLTSSRTFVQALTNVLPLCKSLPLRLPRRRRSPSFGRQPQRTRIVHSHRSSRAFCRPFVRHAQQQQQLVPGPSLSHQGTRQSILVARTRTSAPATP
jgi:hypothetical protein